MMFWFLFEWKSAQLSICWSFVVWMTIVLVECSLSTCVGGDSLPSSLMIGRNHPTLCCWFVKLRGHASLPLCIWGPAHSHWAPPNEWHHCFSDLFSSMNEHVITGDSLWYIHICRTGTFKILGKKLLWNCAMESKQLQAKIPLLYLSVRSYKYYYYYYYYW